jgi:hypothetical protein
LGKEIKLGKTAHGIVLPLGDRYYLETELDRKEVIEAFLKARIM